MKLIKLELKRTDFKGYLLAAAGISAFCLIMAFAFPLIPKMEERSVTGDDALLFATWRGLLLPVSGLIMSCFAVMGGAMAARVVVTEYTGKSALLLFSYPMKRKAILKAKCILMWGLVFTATFLCETVSFLVVGVAANLFHFVPETFGMAEMGRVLAAGAVLGVMAASIGQISMRVGFWKKSLVASVVAAVILICPVTNLFMLGAESGIWVMVGIMVITLAGGIGCYAGLANKIENMEV